MGDIGQDPNRIYRNLDEIRFEPRPVKGHMPDSIELKMPKNREFLGGDLLAQSLERLGVKVAFGLHGGHLDAFLMGCADANIELVDTRHETVAVQAAEGYAKVSGKVGVCFVTANSGFCNGIPGLSTAFADRSPIFCITSSPPLRDAETNALQGFHDQVVIAKPITKFAHRITCVEQIPRLTAYAWRTASSGAPGPVLLDLPIDVLFSPPQMGRISWGSINRPLPYPPAPNALAITEVVDLWRAAERPCIITGTGARGSQLTHHLLKLAETTSSPVFYSSKYSSAFPATHRLRGGPAVRLAYLAPTGNQQPDFMLLLGVRTGFLLGGRGGAIIPSKGCKLVQVDLDGSEIGKSLPIDVGIVADAEQAVTALNAAIGNSVGRSSNEWVKTATGMKNIKAEFEDENVEVSPGRMHPYHALKTTFEALESGAIVSIDGGEAGAWALDLLEHARASIAMASTGYLGFLGNGWGYSLGAAIADPGRQIINIQGDGSAGFHFAELDTFARFKLNIMTVIMNNFCWGMSQSGQELVYGEKVSIRQASKLSSTAAYEQVAAGFQCASAKVNKVSEIKEAVQELSRAGKPSLLSLIVSDKPIHPVTKSMVNVTESRDWIVVPYYDNVPRPHYKT